MTPLDEIVVKAALIDARRHCARGQTPAAAAQMACRGAWAPYRTFVEDQLRAEQGEQTGLYYGDDQAA